MGWYGSSSECDIRGCTNEGSISCEQLGCKNFVCKTHAHMTKVVFGYSDMAIIICQECYDKKNY